MYEMKKLLTNWASQEALVLKNPPTNAGNTRDGVSILGWEDSLKKGMATHSSINTWRIQWTGGLQSIGSIRVRHY